jgi:hypothetical protein
MGEVSEFFAFHHWEPLLFLTGIGKTILWNHWEDGTLLPCDILYGLSRFRLDITTINVRLLDWWDRRGDD